MVFSEMIASREALSQKHKSLRHADNYNEEYPIAVQLAGCDPEIMADAAKLNVDRGADIIDINFGFFNHILNFFVCIVNDLRCFLLRFFNDFLRSLLLLFGGSILI